MPINILMPALSPTMEKGNLAKWLKKEGDKVKSGDVIAEIETDKATMEVEAVDEGTIAKIVVPEGTQDVPVNNVIAVLAGEGEDVKAAASGGASAAPKRPRQRPKPQQIRAPKRIRGSQHRRPSPRAMPHRACGSARSVSPSANGHARIFSSPLARRLAKEAGIELARIAAAARMAASSRVTSRQRNRQGAEGAGAAAPALRAAPCDRARDVGQADPGAVRGRLLRNRAARRHAHARLRSA